MKILIIPTVREIYNNQFEYCVDLKLINFIKKVFKNSKVEIYSVSFKNDYDLIVLAGGNNSTIQNKADKIRNKLNDMIYNFALKKKINMLGICHGTHFLAKKLGFKIEKKQNHIGFHKVNFKINKSTFKRIVNSYHNEIIKIKTVKSVNIFGIAEDNTIEAFHSKNKKILGIMWHPERYIKFKNFDKKLIKEFCATNNIISR
ncbi:gamma-glutamyl-gamma-aminobutyrate hydrolase family protein [Candidatus Pelagibacter sp.]|nr:gamma-glutamyl-gamma-aminobutyrate hydrolase family protein [Candidatus Pelagibacter sp.]